MRKCFWVAIVLTLIFSACGAPPQVQVKDWPMEDKDATGNRVVVKDEKFVYPKTNVIAWKQQLSEPTKPIVADGKVFVACTINQNDKNNRRALDCFDAFTGKLLWSEKYNLYGSPVYSNGNLIFQHSDGEIVCINSQNRKKIWTNKVVSQYYTYAIVDNGCFVLSGEKAIICLDEKTGKKLWEKTVKSDGCVYPIVSSNGRLYYKRLKQLFCVNLSDGKELWKLENPDYIRNLVVYGNSLFYDTSSKLYCLDKDGKESWNFEFSKLSDGSSLKYCIFDNKIYVASGINLYCLDAYSGNEISQQDKITHHSGITYYDQRIFSCDNYGIAWQNLTEKGQTERLELIKPFIARSYYTSYAIAYGNIYFTSEESDLLCINATTGTNAIAFKHSQTNPVQILESDKYWVGDLETDVRIFNKDKLVWKNDKEISGFGLGDGKFVKYLENEKNLVFLGVITKQKSFALIKHPAKPSGENRWADSSLPATTRKQ